MAEQVAPRRAGLTNEQLAVDCQRICVWTGYTPVPMAYLYQGLLGAGAQVRYIRRVQQPDGFQRYDVFAPRACGEANLQRILQFAHHRRFHARYHTPYWKRQSHGTSTRARPAEPVQSAGLRVVSLNVNSLPAKQDEVSHYAERHKVDVLLLQETRCKEGRLPGRLPGYTMYHVEEKSGGGARGVALGVKRAYTSLLESRCDFGVFVRVATQTGEILVGSLYIPTQAQKELRQDALTRVGQVLGDFRRRHPTTPILLGGDFNTSVARMQALLDGWHVALRRLPTSGSPLSWHRPAGRQKWTAIDHFAISTQAGSPAGKSRVDRSVDLSDHFPLSCTVPWMTGHTVPPRIPRTQLTLQLGRISVLGTRIRNHQAFSDLLNRWEAADEGSSSDMNADFFAAAEMVSKDLKLVRGPSALRQQIRISNATLRLIDKRRRFAMRLSKRNFVTQDDYATLAGLRQAVAVALRAEREERWMLFITRGCKLAALGRSRQYWKWLNRLRGPGTNDAASMAAVRDSGGALQTAPEAVLGTWEEYFRDLVGDKTGHSLDRVYWDSKFHSPEAPRVVHAPDLPGLDHPINMIELQSGLQRLVRGKAPGPSGIGPDFLKTALASEEEVREGRIPVLARILLKLVSVMFDGGKILDGQELAHVVPIPKAGDPCNPENYRGISLMDCVLKLLLTILTARLTTAIEDSRSLSPVQAGFRPASECMQQVAALVETVQRRENQSAHERAALEKSHESSDAGRKGYVRVSVQRAEPPDTFLTFLDFQKAFDTVPHELLFKRLELIGIRGNFLRFVKVLYGASTLAVALPFGVSRAVPLCRGVRQGCPLSPLLFNIFIDSLAREICSGVDVPGAPSVGKLDLLLFADDAVLFSDSIPSLALSLSRAERWANFNEMRFNVSKCAIMHVSGAAHPELGVHKLKLHDTVVPIVTGYKYLGIKVSSFVDVAHMAKMRAEATRKAVFAHKNFLTSRSIPTAAKVLVFKTCISGVAAYGGEILGLNVAHAAVIQRQLNVGLRLIAGLSATSRSCSPAVIMTELGIAPVGGRLDGARVRGLQKWPYLRNAILARILKGDGRKALGRTWWTSGLAWMKSKRRVQLLRLLDKAAQKTSGRLSPKQVARVVANYTNGRFLAKAAGQATMRRYTAAQYRRTRLFIVQAAQFPRISFGVTLLMRARLGAFWTGLRAAQAKQLDDEFLTTCPFCLEDSPDTVPHMLLVCSAWEEERARYLADAIAQLGDSPDFSLAALATLILGGRIEQNGKELFMTDWLLPKHAMKKSALLLNWGEGDGLQVGDELKDIFGSELGPDTATEQDSTTNPGANGGDANCTNGDAGDGSDDDFGGLTRRGDSSNNNGSNNGLRFLGNGNGALRDNSDNDNNGSDDSDGNEGDDGDDDYDNGDGGLFALDYSEVTTGTTNGDGDSDGDGDSNDDVFYDAADDIDSDASFFDTQDGVEGAGGAGGNDINGGNDSDDDGDSVYYDTVTELVDDNDDGGDGNDGGASSDDGFALLGGGVRDNDTSFNGTGTGVQDRAVARAVFVDVALFLMAIHSKRAAVLQLRK